MGCSTCKSECGRKDGCGTRKAEQKLLLDGLVARLYPSRTWGVPDDAACFRAGFSLPGTARFSRMLSEALSAPVFVREAGECDLCHFIYVLCVGREPALIELVEGDLGPFLRSGDLHESVSIRERYLRVNCSIMGRMISVQEVALEMDLGCGQAPEGMAVIREIPLPGVFDPRLLKRFQKIVDLALAMDIQHLDMGLLDVPAEQFGLLSGDYPARYGTSPGLFNFFFQAQPVLTASACYLSLQAH